jgi:excisionase family DNA binding protein
VKEACRLTGIGRSKLYELIAAGEIGIIKVGTITLIPTASLERFIELRLRPRKAVAVIDSNRHSRLYVS